MMEEVFPGIFKISLGQPEQLTPVKMRHRVPAKDRLDKLPKASAAPFAEKDILWHQTKRGLVVALPLAAKEQLYGLGLQLGSVDQRGRKKTLRVNSDPRGDLGDSHAPVPFYVSTAGYGVLVDTARYATFYMGTTFARSGATHRKEAATADVSKIGTTAGLPVSAEELYFTRQGGLQVDVIVEIPAAQGVDIYIFAGPSLRDAVARYVMFSGGGCVPPRWGLGVWYRGKGDLTQQQSLDLATSLRKDNIPCDVWGLEPGWQSNSYSCSWAFDPLRYPDPAKFTGEMSKQDYHVNVWTHAFMHPSNELHKELQPHSGTYEVWNGLVPDLSLPEVRQKIAAQHERSHVNLGISGYKVDECDNSDFICRPWSFGEISQFPSGLDGEQFHSLFGVNYQEMIESIYRRRDQRTYGQVRNTHALAANYPFVLYSDLYDHREFLRGLINSGFSGILWSPEVRDATSAEDLIRRLQSVVLSHQALINAWYIKNPPWKQWRTDDNNQNRFLDDAQQLTDACRKIFELRMQLLPYIYAAFYEYHLHGVPPCRALAADWPDDVNTHLIDDQWMLGDRLMAAPVTAGHFERQAYLPQGKWRDFWTGEALEGGRKIKLDVPLDKVPLFVRDNCLLPLARPTLHTADPASMDITVRVYGDGSMGATLFEDDGKTYAYEKGQFANVELSWDSAAKKGNIRRQGKGDFPKYNLVDWTQV